MTAILGMSLNPVEASLVVHLLAARACWGQRPKQARAPSKPPRIHPVNPQWGSVELALEYIEDIKTCAALDFRIKNNGRKFTEFMF